MADAEHALDIARRLFRAIEAGDLDAVHDLYSPEIEVWHNTDGVVQNRDDNLATLRWVVRNLVDLRYDDVRCDVIAAGFVQRHVLCATDRHGREVAVPACIVGTVRGEHIVRIDEYMDSAHIARLTGRPNEGEPSWT